MIGHGLGYQGTVGAILVLAGILVIIVGLYNLRLVARRILNDLDNRGL